MAAAQLRGISRRAALTAAAATLAVAGCTYADREPGLLDGDRSARPPRVAVSSPPPPPLPPANPGLPVAGEATWTSAEGRDVQIRIAAHAVRRTEGATVLDWSVTPLEAPNTRAGDLVPEGFDIGLTRPGADAPDIALVDPEARQVYRPLTRAGDPSRCFCTSIPAVQTTLRIGITTLLQTAYPPLPTGLRRVDVSVATVPPFGRVPVTAAGRAPVANRPTDLRRPAADHDPTWTEMFRYGPGEQVFRLGVMRVVAGSTFTSLEWAIGSVTGGDGLASASTPPFADQDARAYGLTPVAASGPTLQVAGRESLRPRGTRGIGSSGSACLCTDLRGWPSVLRRPDKVATVATSYQVLPPGTRRIDVVFAGHPPIAVPVTRAADPVSPSTVVAVAEVWNPQDPSETGWGVADWPTPVPDLARLDDVRTQVDQLLR